MIDQKRLIGEVAAKNGIRLEPDDPAFALVTLNEIVLQDTVAALTHEIRSSLHSFAESLAKTENRAGKVLAHDVKVAAAELRRELNSDIENASLKAHELVNKVSAVNSSPVMVKWLATGSLAALLLFLCGVIVGTYYVGELRGMCAIIPNLSITLRPEVSSGVADGYGFSVLVNAPNASLTRESFAPGTRERLLDRPPNIVVLPLLAAFVAQVAGM